MMGVVYWVSPFIMDLDSLAAYLQRLSLARDRLLTCPWVIRPFLTGGVDPPVHLLCYPLQPPNLTR